MNVKVWVERNRFLGNTRAECACVSLREFWPSFVFKPSGFLTVRIEGRHKSVWREIVICPFEFSSAGFFFNFNSEILAEIELACKSKDKHD